MYSVRAARFLPIVAFAALILLLGCGGGGGGGGDTGSTNATTNGTPQSDAIGFYVSPEDNGQQSELSASGLLSLRFNENASQIRGNINLTLDPATTSYPLNIDFNYHPGGLDFGQFTGTLARVNNRWYVEGTVTRTDTTTRELKYARLGNPASFEVQGGFAVAGSMVLAENKPAGEMLPGPGGANFRLLFHSLENQRVIFIPAGGTFLEPVSPASPDSGGWALHRTGSANPAGITGQFGFPENIAIPEGSYMVQNGIDWLDNVHLSPLHAAFFRARFVVSASGQCSYPTNIQGRLPRTSDSKHNTELTVTALGTTGQLKFTGGPPHNFNIVGGTGHLLLSFSNPDAVLYDGQELELNF